MLTRRQFLHRSTTLGAFAAGAPAFLWQAQTARGSSEGAPASTPNNRTLIVLQMAGGNDSINMVVPFTDANYLSARKTLRVDPATVLPISDRLSFNPAIKALQPLWNTKQLAVVEGVGYPNPSYSHFSSMAIWQTASPDGAFSDGWLGRYFSRAGDESNALFRGLNVSSSQAHMLEAAGVTPPTIQNPATYRLALDPRDVRARFDAWEDLQIAARVRRKYLPLIGAASVGGYQGTQVLSKAVSTYQPAAEYKDEPLSRGLKLLASMIVQQPGTKVGYVLNGGYDTHTNERRNHDSLLSNLAEAMANFQKDITEHGKADDVLLVTWSEFGRRFQENGSQGTDHGSGGSLLVMGSKVNGGIFGESPDLSKLDGNGSLKWTTDFRSVYATLLENWLGVESAPILGGRYAPLGFVSA